MSNRHFENPENVGIIKINPRIEFSLSCSEFFKYQFANSENVCVAEFHIPNTQERTINRIKSALKRSIWAALYVLQHRCAIIIYEIVHVARTVRTSMQAGKCLEAVGHVDKIQQFNWKICTFLLRRTLSQFELGNKVIAEPECLIILVLFNSFAEWYLLC